MITKEENFLNHAYILQFVLILFCHHRILVFSIFLLLFAIQLINVTLEDVKQNEEVKQLILAAQQQLDVLGYTEHGDRHLSIVILNLASVTA